MTAAPAVVRIGDEIRAALRVVLRHDGLFPERPAGYTVRTTTPFYLNTDAGRTLYKVDRQGLGFGGDIVNDPNYKITPSGALQQTNLDLRYSSPMTRYARNPATAV